MSELPIVLVIDDEVRSLETLERVLIEDFRVLTARGAAEAEALLEKEMVHVILCDQRMPGMSGVEFLTRVRETWPDPVRMILSGYTDSEDIITGINDAGIYQYITKPWVPEELIATVSGAVQLFRLQTDSHIASVEMKQAAGPLKKAVANKKKALKSRFGFANIVHAPASPLAETCELASKCAAFDVSVLLTGESGTGKELLARAIHYNSCRADKPFVVENCGALPDELLESELFGCKKGAFTGAYEDRIGLFEKADGGTVFLDEIGETSPAFQVKLLRVLQEGEIRPLGARMTRKVDVRVISATNRNLEDEVRARRFRRDLYYRLATFPIHLPALRDRPMDIPLLAERILRDTVEGFGRPITGFSNAVADVFARYPWQGNVRELQNEIQRMVVLCDGERLEPEHLSPRLLDTNLHGEAVDGGNGANGTTGPLKDQVERLERRVLAAALKRHNGNISRVAEETGLSRVGLRGKLQRYNLARNGNGAS